MVHIPGGYNHTKEIIKMANIKRLKRLVKVLKKAPEQKFNMKVFMNKSQFEEPVKVKLNKMFGAVDCRSAACAAGWLASAKESIKEGLHIDSSNVVYRNSKGILLSGYTALEDFLEITTKECIYLFSPDSYPERWADTPEEFDMSTIKKEKVLERSKEILARYDTGIGARIFKYLT